MKQILDHGYLKFIEHWGSDERIIEAARMSTNKGFLGWGGWDCTTCGKKDCDSPDDKLHICQMCGSTYTKWRIGDEKLLAYLYEHKHSTPFEMAGMVIEVQAPIFVFREWHRHRTQSFNEMSARYTPLPDLNYLPTVERLMVNSKTNKQAGVIKGAEELTEMKASTYLYHLDVMYQQQEELYQNALKIGVPKELARTHLPVARYSRMRACANLRNWLAFLTLRMAPEAQWEIREYANAVGELIANQFEKTWQLFRNERKYG